MTVFDNFAVFLLIATLGEAVWENLKMVYQSGKFSWDKLGALLIGILLCVGADLDLFAYFGIEMQIPFVGSVLTGIAISRGANWLHDLFNVVQGYVKK